MGCRVVFVWLLLSTVFAGCASTGPNIFTQAESPASATIKARWIRESAFVWEGYRFVSVDDKFVSLGAFADPMEATIRVEPGARSFVIGVQFNRGFGTGPFQAFVPVRATLTSGAIYRVQGEIKGDAVSVWLMDEKADARISEIGTAAWKQSPQSTFVPIVIPSR